MRRDRRRDRLIGPAVAASILVLVATAMSQDIDREQVIGGLSFVDQVQVTVVNIDVFVRDRDGRPVTGLTREDFRLLQDGAEREISHFAAYTEEVLDTVATAPAAPGPSTPGPVADGGSPEADEQPVPDDGLRVGVQPVYIVLYVDNENLRPHDRNRVLAQTRRFVRDIMRPHVQVMVVSAQRSTEIVQPLTNDPHEVDAALRSMTRAYGARVDHDRQRGRIIHDLQATEVDTSGSSPQQARGLEDRIRVYGEELSMELDYSVSSLRDVLTTLAGLQGRKVVVHVSNGLPAVPARDLIDWYGDLFQQRSTLPMLTRFNRRRLFDALASSANALGISFYTIDATGLGGNAAASAEYARPIDPIYASVYAVNHQEPLFFLAERTGGRAIVDSNDVTGLLEQLRDDLFVYYSLGYTLPTAGVDTVHRIEVELEGHPEYTLVYRRTLIEKSVESQVQDTVVSGLMLALDDNPMAIAVDTGPPAPTSEDRWLLPIEISLPLQSVAMLPEGDEYVGRVVLYVANRDVKGRQSDVQRRQFEIRMPPADYEARRGERYVAEFDLLLNAGEHRVSVGMLDPVTRQASFVTLKRSVGAGD
jgi:VWFA-related protein